MRWKNEFAAIITAVFALLFADYSKSANNETREQTQNYSQSGQPSTSTQSNTVSLARGAEIIDFLASEIVRQYPPEKQIDMLPIYFWDIQGKIILLKGTDLFISEDAGGPGILIFSQVALKDGPYFANTNDALTTMANFPCFPRYRGKFVELLKSPNAAVRVGALLALARMPHASLMPAISERLNDANDDVRRAAIIALGPTEHEVLSTFMLESKENEALMRKSVESGFPVPIAHPYRNAGVYLLLEDYLNSGFRANDIPVLLQTIVNLEMSTLMESRPIVHSTDTVAEKYLQQCYRELRIVP